QEDAPDDGEVVPMRRVQRHLSCRAPGELERRRFGFEVDDCDRSAFLGPLADFLESTAGLQLSRRDDIENVAHLSLEYAAWGCIESNLGLVAGADPQEGILLEACGERGVVDVDEHH